MEASLTKTLVVLSPGFAASEQDTVCLPAEQLFLKALRVRFPQTPIIVLAYQYPFTNEAYQWNGIQVIPFNGQNKGKLGRLNVWFRVWRQLEKLNRTVNILGILSFWCTECALIGSWFGRIYAIRHFTWLRGQDARARNTFVKLIRPRAGELIALSDFLQQEFFRNHGIEPQHVIPNGIDVTAYPPVTGERNIDILAVGSLIPLKRHSIFIDIVAQTSASIPGLTAMICGKGPEKENLLAQIDVMGMNATIVMAGELPHPEILALMQRSKIVLHPSDYEGFSNVCMEALYAGAHVISFVQPMKEIAVQHEVVRTPAEMAEKVLAILGDSNRPHQRILAADLDQNIEKMMQLFTG